MVAKRIPSPVWAALALGVTAQVAGCDGDRTILPAEVGGPGPSGAVAGVLGGSSGTTSGFGGDLGGGPPGGRGGTAGRGGDTSDGGTSGSGGQSGDAGEAGQGGTSGDAGGGGDAGWGGDAGGGPEDMTVRGRVVDFWLAPLPNVLVTIGTTTLVTNQNGEFTIAAVAPQYDASLVVTWGGGQAGTYGWRFEGLTRREPTLQVYKGRTSRSTTFTIDPQGETLDATRTLSVAIGGPNGFYQQFTGVGGMGLTSSASWVGSSTTSATFHGLLWSIDSNEYPTSYQSYDSIQTMLVASSPNVTIPLSLADESIGSVTVSGTVTSPSSTDRRDLLIARFADGASIQVVEDEAPPARYGYLAPTLPNATAVVAGSFGRSPFGEFSIAHRNVPASGHADLGLTLLTPLVQVTPASGTAGVTGSTAFSWAGRDSAYVFHVENIDTYDGLFVVTTRRTVTLPTFGSFSLRGNGNFNWRVQTHGDATTVDSLAGPQGYLDPFATGDDRPLGPRTEDGSFTISTGRTFTTAP